MMRSDADDVILENWFTHHAPADGQPHKYQRLRRRGRDMAEAVMDECPPSPERDAALDKIREAVMWANASIACGS